MDRVFDFIAGAGIVQGLFVASILLFHRRGPGAWALAALIGSLSLSIAHFFFGPAIGALWSAGLSVDPFQSLLGPLIWLFVSARTRGRHFRARDLLHFAPCVATSVFLAAMSFLTRHPLLPAKAISIAYWSAVLCQTAVYFVASSGLVFSYSKRLAENYSRLDAFRLETLHAFMGSILVLLAGKAIGLFVFVHAGSWHIVERGLEILLALSVYALGIFIVFRREPPIDAIRKEAGVKYRKSSLSSADICAESERLDAYMRSAQPHLDPELNLGSLADSFGLPRNELSRVINEGRSVSFYDYVNAFRVAEFKALAADPAKRNWKILALALEAGFNSKPAFNAFFKSSEGTTPSAWIKARAEK